MEGPPEEFAAMLMSLGASAVGWAVAEEPSAASVGKSKAYVGEVSDVTAEVGEPAVMRATLKARDGYQILKHYNNRVIQLSSFDDGVAFEQRMVPATLDEDTLVFEVPSTPPRLASTRSTGLCASVTFTEPMRWRWCRSA